MPQGKEPVWPPAAPSHPLNPHPLSSTTTERGTLVTKSQQPPTGPQATVNATKKAEGLSGQGPTLPSGAAATPTRRPLAAGSLPEATWASGQVCANSLSSGMRPFHVSEKLVCSLPLIKGLTAPVLKEVQAAGPATRGQRASPVAAGASGDQAGFTLARGLQRWEPRSLPGARSQLQLCPHTWKCPQQLHLWPPASASL